MQSPSIVSPRNSTRRQICDRCLSTLRYQVCSSLPAKLMLVFVSNRFLLLVTLSCTVFSAILRLPCMDHADFSVVHVNKVLKGYGIATHENVNDIKCTVKCVEHYKCRSYDFNANDRRCQLNSKAFGDKDTELIDSPGWYYKSTDYNNTLVSKY